MGEVSSIEAKGDLVIDSRLANEGNGWAGSGANPWRLDDETESVLFLTNMGDRESRIGFKVTALGVEYFLIDLVLKPHETRALDIRKLRDEEEPDFLGNTIPSAATDGSVSWIRADMVPVMGRMVTLRRKQGTASSYQCTTCCCPATLTPSMNICHTSITGIPDDTHQYGAQAQYISCGQSYWWIDVTNSATWSSNNTSIATISNAYGTKGLATAVAGGSATFLAKVTDSNYVCEYWYGVCSYYGMTTAQRNSTCTVQTPTFLTIVPGSSTTTSESSCNNGQGCGVHRYLTYQVNDAYGNPIQRAGMQFWDQIATTSPDDLYLSSYVTTCTPPNTGPCNQTTDALGRFNEHLLVCAYECTSPSGFCILAGHTNATQTWHVGGYTLSADIKTLSYYCDHILVNGN